MDQISQQSEFPPTVYRLNATSILCSITLTVQRTPYTCVSTLRQGEHEPEHQHQALIEAEAHSMPDLGGIEWMLR